MLACAANQDGEVIRQVESLIDKAGADVEKTYEFLFNMSQVLMKKQLQEEAFRCLVQAYTMAKQDEESVLHGDLTRFKI